MRRRNREVNIFNMSLLDILCGALGAFCFMMLSLFPDHAKVKDLQAKLGAAEHNSNSGTAQQAQKDLEDARKQLQQARNDQTLVWFRVQWDGGQDIDLYVQGNSGKICSSKENLIAADKRGGCHITDRTKGPASEQYWFSNAGGDGVWYRLFARLQNRNGVTMPAAAHGVIVARNSSGEQDVMTLEDLGSVQFTRDSELIELGWIQFSRTDFTVTRGPKKDGERIATLGLWSVGSLGRVDRWP
jgi:hypothetical protein